MIKALLYTDGEGKNFQPIPFDLFQDEVVNNHYRIEQVHHFSDITGDVISSQVALVNDIKVHSVLFSDGSRWDVLHQYLQEWGTPEYVQQLYEKLI